MSAIGAGGPRSGLPTPPRTPLSCSRLVLRGGYVARNLQIMRTVLIHQGKERSSKSSEIPSDARRPSSVCEPCESRMKQKALDMLSSKVYGISSSFGAVTRGPRTGPGERERLHVLDQLL